MLLFEVEELFVINNGIVVSLQPSPFIREAAFQKMLEDYPEILSGDLIDPDDPRRWVLIKREIGIPGEANGPARWFADHLFLDQDGTPTIVEVKLQTNPEIRLAVVKQLLQYAANSAAYWNVQFIQSEFSTTCSNAHKNPQQVLRDRLSADLDIIKFWAQVKTNLEAQKIRLLFVSDVIPSELRRIVEFLNQQMNPVEVLALELKRYVLEDGSETLVPTLFGLTQRARSLKSGLPSKNWDEGSFFDQINSETTPEVVASAHRVFSWIEQNTNGLEYGHGNLEGSVSGYILANGLKLFPISLWTTGKVLIGFNYCRKAPFDDLAKRMEFLEKLNDIPGVKLADDCIDSQPPILLSNLVADDGTDRFLRVLDWFAEQVKAGPSTSLTIS